MFPAIGRTRNRRAALGCTAWVVLALGACGTDSSRDGGSDAAADHTGSIDDAAPGADGSIPPDGGPGFVVQDGCVPATRCPPGVTCGRYTDPCSGSVFTCGSACATGQVCVADANNPASQSCQPKACTGKCGVVGTDACGVVINCGGCGAGLACVDNACVTPDGGGPTADAGQCAALTCTPAAQTKLCGTVTDGCGHTMACSCPSGQFCIGGECAPLPPECSNDGGAACGTVANACGSGNIACPTKCAGDTSCVKGVCTTCTPPACGARTCGQVSNGCGPAVSCGSCGGETCYDGGCCNPRTCADAIDAGAVPGCAPIDMGCGVKQSCSPCSTGEICTNDQCVACVPKTCADFGNAGCGHSDGCGKTLDCCPAGTACTGNICCSEGLIAYNGSCCAPSCDPAQPAGTQVSCGQVIYCPGSGGGPR
jgi:hypothetical protein